MKEKLSFINEVKGLESSPRSNRGGSRKFIGPQKAGPRQSFARLLQKPGLLVVLLNDV